jgi:hypothetical protein
VVRKITFTSEKEAIQPITDLPKIVADATAQTKLFENIKINKKFVKKANPEELATAVTKLMVQGVKEKRMQKLLVKQGVEPDYATNLVARIKQAVDDFKKTPEGRRSLSRKYRNQMIAGFIWFAIGLAVTIGTFMAASEGGTYIIAYGAIIWGIGGLIVGLIGWIRYSRSV